MRPFSRRNFFKIAGVAAAGAAGVSLGRKQGPLPDIGEGAPWSDREERWVATVCQLCPGGCGIRARVVDGRVVKVEGNPVHPVNRGRLCPVGQAAPQLLYHPDRLRLPMVRDAGGKLGAVPWDEAISLLALKLKELRGRGEAHTAVFLAGHYRGLRERFLRRFMTAYGSPNYIRSRGFSADEADPAHSLTQGVGRPLVPDLFEARSILSFGVPLLEGGPSPVHQMRAYGHFRQGEGRPRGILIQVEPRRSATAERADKWVAPHPETETALALGVAHALILEGLFDEEFVNRYCEGFNDRPGPDGQILPGFRAIVLREFTLPRVSQATGVPVETILNISRTFARNQPGVAIGGPEFPSSPTRLGLRLAVHFLNALVGNIGRRGGMLLQERPPLGEWGAPKADDLARRSLAQARVDGAGRGLYALAGDVSEALPERILSGKPYPVNVLLAAGTDPLFDHPRSREFAGAIGRVPFVVSFSSMPDSVTQKAHLVLPDAIFLERWTEDVVTHVAGFSAVSLGQPVVRSKDSPLGLEDTLLKVAKQVGGTVGESFDWETFADALFEGATFLLDAGRGYVASDPVQERFRTILRRQGYWQKEHENADKLWEALLQQGAWWDPSDEEQGAAGQLLHPRGKFQFLPERLDRLLAGFEPQARQTAEGAFGLKNFGGALLPSDAPRPQRNGGEFDLILFRPLALLGDASAELPWLQEQLGFHRGGRWDSWVELHPADAKRLGLREGDPVEVFSEAGALRTKARIFKGVQPGTLAMPVGLGRKDGGRWAKGRGVDPRALARAEADPVWGLGLIGPARVRVRRIG